MTKKLNDKKSEQLGMNHSTASNRLRKKILFMFVQRLKFDKCFQCNNLIVEVEDLSIEHKKPWLDEDPRLFWDMGNIAFSHRSCNSAVARYNSKYNRKKYEHRIEDRKDEYGHYPSSTWYDRGCRCDECKKAKRNPSRRGRK